MMDDDGRAWRGFCEVEKQRVMALADAERAAASERLARLKDKAVRIPVGKTADEGTVKAAEAFRALNEYRAMKETALEAADREQAAAACRAEQCVAENADPDAVNHRIGRPSSSADLTGARFANCLAWSCKPRKWSWPPWASCVVGWLITVGIDGALVWGYPRDRAPWQLLVYGAMNGFSGVILGARIDEMIREMIRDGRRLADRDRLRRAAHSTKSTTQADPGIIAAGPSRIRPGCAVCGEAVVESMPWWNKDPEKYPDALPIHEGRCWAKWRQD